MTVGITQGNVKGFGVATITFNPAAVSAATSAEQTVTVPGLLVGDMVWVNKPSATTGVGIVGCRVSAADTLAITFMNATAGSVDPASESYSVLWIRPDASASGVVI